MIKIYPNWKIFMNINQQRGSGSSFLLLSIIIISSLVFFFKLFPIYMENWNVSSALEKVAEEQNVTQKVDREIYQLFLSFLSKKDVKLFNRDNIKQFVNIERRGQSIEITVEYEQTKPLMANVSFLVQFKNTVEIP
ncbi:MAG TPA: DUF4845 domain-containing protein [Thioploca sp.]|nr:DUF4845 domain-containing protein [Thioploca sp.]